MVFYSCGDSPLGVERRFITFFFIKTNIQGRSELRNLVLGEFTKKESNGGISRNYVWDTKKGCKNYKGGRKDYRKKRASTIFLDMPELELLNPYKIVKDFLKLIPSRLHHDTFPLFLHPRHKYDSNGNSYRKKKHKPGESGYMCRGKNFLND